MHPLLLFISILLIMANASASCSDEEIEAYLLDLPNQECWNGDWEIASEHGAPVKIIRSNGHIRGWIDIIGFREMCAINGTMYVNGSAKDFAIVESDAWHTPVSGTVVSFKSSRATIGEEQSTTAIQYTSFHWKYKKCTLTGCKWVHVYESQTISYSTLSPEKYDIHIQDVPIHITVCNRSFQPLTHILVPETTSSSMTGVMDACVRYNGSNISRYDQVGFVVDNDRGTEYVEFVPFDDPSWIADDNQDSIGHFLGAATINDPDFNVSKLQIRMRTPYETRNATNYTITTIEEDAPIEFNVPLIRVLALLAGSGIAIIALVGVTTRTSRR